MNQYQSKKLRELTPEQLQNMLQELQGELRQMRFLAANGELKQNHKMKDVKRSIARIKTIMNQSAAAPAPEQTKA